MVAAISELKAAEANLSLTGAVVVLDMASAVSALDMTQYVMTPGLETVL